MARPDKRINTDSALREVFSALGGCECTAAYPPDVGCTPGSFVVDRTEGRMKRLALIALVLAALCMGGCANEERQNATGASTSDQAISGLFDSQQSGVEVQDTGTVTRTLSDDAEGGRHQRFIVRLASGQTLLIAHNIDIAPRLEPLSVGDTVEFRGEYAWNDQGGVIHWTHHDPSGSHEAGWLKRGSAVVQ